MLGVVRSRLRWKDSYPFCDIFAGARIPHTNCLVPTCTDKGGTVGRKCCGEDKTSVAFKFYLLFTGICVQQLNCRFQRAGEEASIRRKSEGIAPRPEPHKSGVTPLRINSGFVPAGLSIPQSNVAVSIFTSKGFPIRRKNYRRKRTGMIAKGCFAVTRLHVPQPNCLPTRIGEGPPIGRKRNRSNPPSIFESSQQLVCLWIPQADFAIVTATHEDVAVRRKRNRTHRRGMSVQQSQFSTGVSVI